MFSLKHSPSLMQCPKRYDDGNLDLRDTLPVDIDSPMPHPPCNPAGPASFCDTGVVPPALDFKLECQHGGCCEGLAVPAQASVEC